MGVATSRRSRTKRDSRLQLALELVEETPVGALGEERVRAGGDHADLMETEGEKPQ